MDYKDYLNSTIRKIDEDAVTVKLIINKKGWNNNRLKNIGERNLRKPLRG